MEQLIGKLKRGDHPTFRRIQYPGRDPHQQSQLPARTPDSPILNKRTETRSISEGKHTNAGLRFPMNEKPRSLRNQLEEFPRDLARGSLRLVDRHSRADAGTFVASRRDVGISANRHPAVGEFDEFCR